MNEVETNKHRATLLAQARTILNDEYQQKRSEEYSKWQRESNHLWVTKGILLPYPSSFGYPTEDEVVKKALELYNKENGIKVETTQPLPTADDSMTSSVTERLNEASKKVKPSSLPQVPQTTPWEQYLAPNIVPNEQKPQEEPSTVPDQLAAPENLDNKTPLEFPPLATAEPITSAEDNEPEELSTAEELEQVIEEVLEENLTPGDKKETSHLRNLLAQFVTLAKKLDADKDKKDN